MSRHQDLDCKVYIGDLARETNEKDVERACSYYGPLKSVWVARNPAGFSFVEFDDPRDAEDAVSGLDGSLLCGVRIRVEHSTGKIRPKPWLRGGRSGGGGRGRGGRAFHPDDKCYQCGDRGHYAYDCRLLCGVRIRVEHSTGKIRPKPWLRGGRSGGGGRGRGGRAFHPDDKCYQCGDRGHYAYDCRRFNRGGRRYSRSRSRSRSRGRRSYSRGRRSYTRSRSRSRDRRDSGRDRRRSRDRYSRDKDRSSRDNRSPASRSRSRSRSPPRDDD